MKKLISFLVILGIVGILFFPYFKNQNAPLPIDIPVGMYYPWLNESYGYAVRPPVKNSLISDTVSQFWIWRNRGVGDLVQGKLNIWNPYSFSGYEMSPWFHTILFSPLNIFYATLEQVDAMSMIVIAQVAISLLGCFLLGSVIFSSALAGWALAIGWTLSSYFTGWLTWGTISFTLAMLPWTLYFYERYLVAGKKRISLFLCLMSLVFLILSGHPQSVGYGLIVFYIWTVIRSAGSGKKLLSSLLTPFVLVITGIVVSAPAIYPSLSIIGNSIRSFESLSAVNFGFIPWSKLLLTFLSVNVFGNPSTGNYFGGDYNFQEKLVNFGIIPFFLTVYQIVKIIRTRKIESINLIGITLFFLGLLLTTQYPFGFLIYHFNIPLLSTSPAGRAIILAIFGGIILSSNSILDILKKKVELKSMVITTLVFILTFAVLFAILIGSLRFISQSSPEMLSYYQSIKDNYTTSARNSVYPLAILCSFFVLLFLSQKLNKLRSVAVGLMLALMFIEGFLFFKKVTPFVPKNLLFPETPSIAFIKGTATRSADLFRFERESGELLPPNMWEVFGFYSTSGYDPIAPLRYEQYMKGKDVHGTISRYFENGAALDKLDNLGVKYLMALKRNDISVPDKDGKLSGGINQKLWKPVFSEGPVVVLENLSYTPPYFFTVTTKGDRISLDRKADDIWEFTVVTKTDNSFVLMENNSSHWSATVDSSPVKINDYKETFKEVAVPKGEHKLTFTYINPDVNKGIVISLVGLVCFLLFLVIIVK